MSTAIQAAEPKKDKKVNLRYLRDKDREMVKGIFRYHECPGGMLSFPFKKWKEDEVETYHLMDGEVYTVPLGVAHHLNKNLWYPVHAYAMDENGKSLMKIGQKVRRASFQSLEFVDVADLTPEGNSVITVERV